MGRHEQWDEMYISQRKSLVDYAANILGSRDEAEDIVQEAYLNISRSETNAGDEGDSPVRAYFFRVVRNLSFNKIKRRKLNPRAELGNVPWWAIPASAENPEDATILHDRVTRIVKIMSNLPERTRSIIKMHRFEGFTLEEIAKALDLSTSTTHRLLSDGLEELKAGLRKDVI